MLMLAALQFAFVAIEASAVAHAPQDEDSHHQSLLADGQQVVQADAKAPPGEVLAEACDQCFLCHGHGAHIALLSSSHPVGVDLSANHPLADESDQQPTFVYSIHRPPIA